MSTPFYEQVANKLIDLLEKGTSPFQLPWTDDFRMPYNPISNKQYRGINRLHLQFQDYSDPRWMTFKQANDLGAQVKKGEKGSIVEYWKFTDTVDLKNENGELILDGEGKKQTVTVNLERPKLFRAVVFNAEQIDGLPPLEQKILMTDDQRHTRADNLLKASGANFEIGQAAYYTPTLDKIVLPHEDRFHSKDAYYAVALHELAHWTGHENRLNRDLKHSFGSEGYAREELRAEITSMIVGEELEIGRDPERHASYIDNWIKILKEDPKEIFRASAEAEKISQYLFSFDKEKELEKESTKESFMLKNIPEKSDEKIYLAIPFSEKDAAKAIAKENNINLRWDKDQKSWFISASDNPDPLKKWSLNDSKTTFITPLHDIQQQFKAALIECDLIVDSPVMDGQIHRVKVKGDKGSEKSGAYVGHSDGLPSGYIQNFKTGVKINWKSDNLIDLNAEQRDKLVQEAKEKRKERADKIDSLQNETANVAKMMWGNSHPASDDNAYCKLKKISPIGLKVVPEIATAEMVSAGIQIGKTLDDVKKLREVYPEAHVFKAGDLLIPGRDIDGNIWTLQSVNPHFKALMKNGKKKDVFSIAGIDPLSSIKDLKPDTIIIAEGYATAASVSDLSKTAVIVAFDSGNLTVANTFKDLGVPIIIAADNDHTKPPKDNVGLLSAQKVAHDVAGGVVFPDFEEGAKGSDWNDKVLSNPKIAKAEFKEKLIVAKQMAIINAVDKDVAVKAKNKSKSKGIEI